MTEAIAMPNSKESEMMVLGSMLTSINSLNIAADSLSAFDFYYTEHQTIFSVLKTAYKNDKPADVHLVCEELKRQDKLNSVGGPAYVTSLAQFAGTSAFIEEYVDVIKEKSTLRAVHNISIETQQSIHEGLPAKQILEKLKNTAQSLESYQSRKIPIIETSNRLKREEDFLKIHRGQKYLGLKVKTIAEFNENFLGLRGLMLLAAAPNVGKTALTVQIALEVLQEEKDACLVYVSLEMSEEQIFRRMLLNLSGLNFRTFVFGSERQQIIDDEGYASFFKMEELQLIKEAENTIRSFGSRLQIIDQTTCPYIDANTIVNYVESIKERTSTSRAIVIIDYLQVWQAHSSLKFTNDLEADKWRIGEMKKMRDALNQDPVIVISEARKPSGKEDSWGGDLSDVMGSARGTYTPDVVMLLSAYSPKALIKIWEERKLPSPPKGEDVDCGDADKEGIEIRNFLAKQGIALCKLDTPKVRDGMERFSTVLEFHFHKNTFRKVNVENMKKLITDANKTTKKGLF
jgi:replicative DNA helicase